MMERYKYLMIMAVISIVIISCTQSAKQEQTMIKNDRIFPRGEKITSSNFIGTAWLNSLVEADNINQNAAGSVTFEPGARTNWHSHPAGQIILALEGEGYYQEKGQPKKVLNKGDVVKCPPNVAHWHGASADRAFIQIAITSRQNGPTKWLKPVNEEEYSKKNKMAF